MKKTGSEQYPDDTVMSQTEICSDFLNQTVQRGGGGGVNDRDKQDNTFLMANHGRHSEEIMVFKVME